MPFKEFFDKHEAAIKYGSVVAAMALGALFTIIGVFTYTDNLTFFGLLLVEIGLVLVTVFWSYHYKDPQKRYSVLGICFFFSGIGFIICFILYFGNYGAGVALVMFFLLNISIFIQLSVYSFRDYGRHLLKIIKEMKGRKEINVIEEMIY